MMKMSTALKAATLALFGASAVFALPKASDLVADMGLGYNIGNTMEVPGNPTGWGNDFPTAEYVKAIKAAGFNTVRIPCAWDSHASNGTINAGWLDSVKTVVDLVVGEGMYAMLNSHWDNGWLEDHVFDGKGYDKTGEVNSSAATVAAKQESYWKQIATKFAAYDEHLIFASANEPGVNDPWNGGADNGQWAFDENRMKVLKQFHEACLKAVRSTGGNNATRIVVVQAPRTEIEKAPLLAAQYPTDPAGAGYTMAEIHFYPYQFSLMTGGDEDWGKMFYYWEDKTPGTDAAHTCKNGALGSKTSIDELFGGLNTQFASKGIPVVIGEMGAVKRLDVLSGANLKSHLEARAAWYGYTAASAKKNGLIPCVWDTGDEGDGNFTIIRRQTKKFSGKVGDITDYETLNALRKAYGMSALTGNSIDDKVSASLDENNKMLEVTYTSATSDSNEVGTIRIDLGGKDWSQYKAISFQAKVNAESQGPAKGEDYGWMTLSLFAMSGSTWTWNDYNFEEDEITTGWKTYTVPLGPDGLDIENIKSVNAIGINLYGTQLKGTIAFDNLVLIKKTDGSKVVLSDFDKKTPTLDGIATGKLVTSTAPSSGSTAIKAIAATGKMQVNVTAGRVSAMFQSATANRASVTLLNAAGQVIARQNLTTKIGANEVSLETPFRGKAFLVVKQGASKFTVPVNMQ